MNAVNLELYEH